jgi:hypothetical protein
MNHISPHWEPRRIPPVDAELLASAIFLFSEYLAELSAERLAPGDIEEEVQDLNNDEPPLDARAVLDRFTEELGTDPKTTLTLYMRLTALFRLLSSTPNLASIATDPSNEDELTQEALVAAATLELYSNPMSGASGDFDPRDFQQALETD